MLKKLLILPKLPAMQYTQYQTHYMYTHNYATINKLKMCSTHVHILCCWQLKSPSVPTYNILQYHVQCFMIVSQPPGVREWGMRRRVMEVAERERGKCFIALWTIKDNKSKWCNKQWIYTVHVHVHKETIDINVITNVYKTQRERGGGKRRGEREGQRMRERDGRREGGIQCICSH